ncbi:hypothetical protein TARUN_6980 [Trichoderma arundinaceum]|uniref:RNase MRP protein 1 RNA binding domain-containing protein n=1 Tax=Trichoderma arundinaceum TaxID=490622 RepID=A0A395NHJ3_TRIAR|nr:hypothetical protein TARUN_6980 [Trichoderma arundinaceum]
MSASATAHSLSPLLPILNAFNHRHHNQHRLAHWWPVFRILRRTIRNLVDDLTPPSSSLSSRPARRETSSSSAPPPRAVWLKKHFLPRAYIAFTQLAADNQHAPLGLLLLTILARVHTTLSNLLADNIDSANPAKALSSKRSNDALNQDKGIAIARQDLTPANKITTPPPTERPQLSKPDRDAVKPPKAKTKDTPSSSLTTSLKEKKKKKKGKGDELSSLFGSLA